MVESPVSYVVRQKKTPDRGGHARQNHRLVRAAKQHGLDDFLDLALREPNPGVNYRSTETWLTGDTVTNDMPRADAGLFFGKQGRGVDHSE